jgi:predicted nuclease of restriction endonuclease-like (RecB) superfamily
LEFSSFGLDLSVFRYVEKGKLKREQLQMELAISNVKYERLLAEIKQQIRSAQTRAALAVNRELVLLYWQIGRQIAERQEVEGWGAKVIDRLAADLGREFPGVEGFGARNLRNMRDIAKEWPDASIVQQLVAKLPWGHNIQILRVAGRLLRSDHIVAPGLAHQLAHRREPNVYSGGRERLHARPPRH